MAGKAFIFRISPGNKDRVEDALAADQLIIGWADAEGLLDQKLIEDDFKKIIRQAYPEETAHWIGNATTHMWRFVREMSPGDLVLVPRKNEIYFAQIADGPTFDPKLQGDDTGYRRKVRWYNGKKSISKKTLSAPLIAAIKRLRRTSSDATALFDQIAKAAGAETDGEDWTPIELEAVVTDYRDMLLKELAGKPYNKSEHRRALMEKIKRSKGSIEFKHQNISAVLEEIGSPWIKGYMPRHNYQDALVDVVERIIAAKVDDLPPPVAPKGAIDPEKVFVQPPSVEDEEKRPKAAPTKRLAWKIDQAARDARNRDLGKDGEKFVVDLERKKLAKFPHLARDVAHHAKELGDGLGYDVFSFDEKGNKLFIEVKTTRGGKMTPFYISKSELEASAELGPGYRLYRVYEFDDEPQCYVLQPPLAEKLDLSVATYRAIPHTSSALSSTFRYFAYGSNMSTKRLRERTPGCIAKGLAALPRHKLCFHKKSQDGSAKCDAFFTGSLGDAVVGVVFEIPTKEKPDLDNAEGLGKGYDEREVELILSDGSQSKAIAYIANPAAINDKLEPFEWYHAYVLEGAREHGLPTDYIVSNIQSVKTRSGKQKRES